MADKLSGTIQLGTAWHPVQEMISWGPDNYSIHLYSAIGWESLHTYLVHLLSWSPCSQLLSKNQKAEISNEGLPTFALHVLEVENTCYQDSQVLWSTLFIPHWIYGTQNQCHSNWLVANCQWEQQHTHPKIGNSAGLNHVLIILGHVQLHVCMHPCAVQVYVYIYIYKNISIYKNIYIYICVYATHLHLLLVTLFLETSRSLGISSGRCCWSTATTW